MFKVFTNPARVIFAMIVFCAALLNALSVLIDSIVRHLPPVLK